KARAAEMRTGVAKRRAAWLTSLVGENLSILAERDGTGYAPNYARVDLADGTQAGALVEMTACGVEGGLLR
uniref:hypothetical protein n=1 Tax=Janibacter hoylei TaxID=364298 RepID=UPI0024932F47